MLPEGVYHWTARHAEWEGPVSAYAIDDGERLILIDPIAVPNGVRALFGSALGQPHARDHILDNITLYWLTGTGASAARSYWEAYGPDAPAAGRQQPLPRAIPFAFTTFPGEIWRTPRSWVEASYPNVIYFNAADKGGHFAAWEEPEVFSEELRAAFKSLR